MAEPLLGIRAAFGAFERPPVEQAAARGSPLFAGWAGGIFGGREELPMPEPTRIEAVT
jgi:hypothetical protein